MNKCRNQECLSLLHAALRDGSRSQSDSGQSGRNSSTSDRIRNRIRTMSNPLKSRHLADTMESSFQCSSVWPKNIIVELFNDSAQIEFSEGSLRCSTILYAKIIKSGDEQIQKFFKMKDNINFPSSSQLWAKPISIEIPGKFPSNPKFQSTLSQGPWPKTLARKISRPKVKFLS